MAEPGDLVICLGAGNITIWANSLPKDLEEIFQATGANSARKPKEFPNSKYIKRISDTKNSDAAIMEMEDQTS